MPEPQQQETGTRPPKPAKAYGTCDWGGCDEPAVDHRWAAEPEHRAWLEVCAAHREETETRELVDPRFRLLEEFAAEGGVCQSPASMRSLLARVLLYAAKGEAPSRGLLADLEAELGVAGLAAASLPTGGGRDEAGVCDRGCCEWATDGSVLRYREHLDCRYCSDDAAGRDRLGRPCCEACNPDDDELEPLRGLPASLPTGGGRERNLRLALLAVLAVSDASLMPDADDEDDAPEVEALFRLGFLRSRHVEHDRVVAELTEAGRSFVAQAAAGPNAGSKR